MRYFVPLKHLKRIYPLSDQARLWEQQWGSQTAKNSIGPGGSSTEFVLELYSRSFPGSSHRNPGTSYKQHLCPWLWNTSNKYALFRKSLMHRFLEPLEKSPHFLVFLLGNSQLRQSINFLFFFKILYFLFFFKILLFSFVIFHHRSSPLCPLLHPPPQMWAHSGFMLIFPGSWIWKWKYPFARGIVRSV